MNFKRYLKIKSKFLAQKGFSLLEIIIVVAIIGTLMGIIVSRITGGADSAKDGITTTKAISLHSKLIQYQLANNGKFPTTEQGLQGLLVNPGTPIATEDELIDGRGNKFDYRLSMKEGPCIISYDDTGKFNDKTMCFIKGKKDDCNKIADLLN